MINKNRWIAKHPEDKGLKERTFTVRELAEVLL
jgi:hypothetical protein